MKRLTLLSILPACALFALPATAPGAEDKKASGFDRLYAAAAARDAGALKSEAGRAVYGTDGMQSRPSPVMSVLRLKRLPDGTTVLSCGIEDTGFHAIPEGDDRPGRPK